MGEDEEMETILPTVKAYPKSAKVATSALSTKRKLSRNLSLSFAPPEPKQVELVEPEEVPPTPKIDHT